MLPALEAAFAHSQRIVEDSEHLSDTPYFSPSRGVIGLHALSDTVDKTYNKFSG